MNNHTNNSINNLVLEAKNISKTYTEAKAPLTVLKDINLSLQKGERLAIVGSSGSGKTTLLNILSGLDSATSGEVEIVGTKLTNLSEDKKSQLRNKHLGFVYQFHHLLAEFSAIENVAMPFFIGKIKKSEALNLAEEILCNVGLKDRLHHKPALLSGGERQRVAIARALVHKPACVLMDEPTGNLDQTTASKIQELIINLSENLGTGFILVTHDTNFANQQNKVMQLTSGNLIAE